MKGNLMTEWHQARDLVGVSSQACQLLLGKVQLVLKKETTAPLTARMPKSMIRDTQGLVMSTVKLP